jgi:hypothetical protein
VVRIENLVTESESDEVDDVTGRADEAELCQLDPIASPAQPLSDAPRNAGGPGGGTPVVRVSSWWDARVCARGLSACLSFVASNHRVVSRSTLGLQARVIRGGRGFAGSVIAVISKLP